MLDAGVFEFSQFSALSFINFDAFVKSQKLGNVT